MRALVCGAGIAGLTAARLLAGSGWQVQAVEKSPGPRGGGYLIDFFGPGFATAERTGLLPRLGEIAHRVDRVTYATPGGRPTATLDYGRLRSALHGRLLSLLRGDLEAVLLEGLDHHVAMSFGTTVTGIASAPEDQVDVELSDGSHSLVDLVVGADGIHSAVRALVFGPERDVLRHLGCHTAAYLFEDADLHDRLAGRFLLTDVVDRQLGLYGVRGGRVAVFAAHRDPGPAPPEDPCAALRDHYAGLGPLAARALDRCPGDVYYDVVAQICMPRWTSGRVVLVGDACGAVSLLAGQGASLAMAGAEVLAQELGRGPTVAASLGRYESRLQPVVAASQAAGRRSARWFLPHSAAQLRLRRIALRAMRLPGLDRLLASRLVGNAGRVP